MKCVNAERTKEHWPSENLMKNVTLRFILPGAVVFRQGMTKYEKRLKYAMNDHFDVVDSNRERLATSLIPTTFARPFLRDGGGFND